MNIIIDAPPFKGLNGRPAKPLKIAADMVDVPVCAGTCDPLDIVGTDFGGLISDAARMFGKAPKGLNTFVG